MHRKARILPSAMLLACLVILAEMRSFAIEEGPALTKASAAAEEPAAEEASGAEAPTAPPAREKADAADEKDATEDSKAPEEPAGDEEPGKVKRPAPPPLSPEMTALRDNLRKALALVATQPLNTRDNTPGEVILLSLALGCDANVGYNGPSGKKINAIGCLCWDYPCAGYRLLRTGGGPVMARVGYGLQAHPAQFLAVLAQSRVPADYEIRLGEYRATVADLVEFEKLNCRTGTDLSCTLIGLAHYVEDKGSWKNDLGEEWSVDRLVGEELARSTSTSDSDVTNRLMGLSYAIQRRKKQGQPVDGTFSNAQQYLGKFHDFALDVQNPDGSWHPSFFAHKGTSRDTSGTLRSTGHICEWLVFSLPKDRLEDPRVVRSVAYLVKALGTQRSRTNVASTSLRDVGAMMHAAHALAIYDGRLFESGDADESAEEEAVAVASRSTPE